MAHASSTTWLTCSIVYQFGIKIETLRRVQADRKQPRHTQFQVQMAREQHHSTTGRASHTVISMTHLAAGVGVLAQLHVLTAHQTVQADEHNVQALHPALHRKKMERLSRFCPQIPASHAWVCTYVASSRAARTRLRPSRSEGILWCCLQQSPDSEGVSSCCCMTSSVLMSGNTGSP